MKSPRLRTAASQSARRRRERLYSVLRAARRAFPHNKSLRRKWVRAKLALGNRQPKVKVGLEQRAVFARSTSEAQSRRDDFTALAPRTMREAGIK